ncbi:MAG: capsule biosynthesis protein [Silicimonas sp.]|nr:capsule biosynthesis protein [Silicimonas sp.]
MTTNPKAPKFRIRRNSARPGDDKSLTPPSEDGFGEAAFPGSAKAEDTAAAEAAIADIRREGLTGRQLRMARRLAQKQNLNPSSDFDAVRLLRDQGIDPFDRQNMIELVKKEEAPEAGQGDGAGQQASPQSQPQPGQAEPRVRTKPALKAGLPQKIEVSKQLPGEHIPQAEAGPMGMHEIERIQRDIVRRRRRKLAFLGARLSVFVLLPTALAFYYFAFIATPSYATKSEFIVQQAEVAASSAGLLGGTPLAASQDSILVQDFLTSRGALQKLDGEYGYREHFSDPSIDDLQRVAADASNEDLYAHYKKSVKVGFDPTEGVLRMEVAAMTPEMSRIFSEALIGYAEERVDRITERKRADQMRGANESFKDSEKAMVNAQEKVLTLQEQLGVLDPASETTALMGQVSNLETQLTEKRLQLSQLLDNAAPNQARVAGVRGDVERLEALIADLRAQMTTESGGANSLASVTARLRMAEVDLETRTMMMQESLQQLEAARIEASRQVRFLSVGVTPVPPDEPTYPRVFENTLIAFLIFGAIYLLASVTAAILREQVSS